ncbi:hypothetical protein MRX96_058269 [Rhipicephalus microplus]
MALLERSTPETSRRRSYKLQIDSDGWRSLAIEHHRHDPGYRCAQCTRACLSRPDRRLTGTPAAGRLWARARSPRLSAAKKGGFFLRMWTIVS